MQPVWTLQATCPLLIYGVVPRNSRLYAKVSGTQVSTFYHAAGIVFGKISVPSLLEGDDFNFFGSWFR
jgi:hypothetical protein